MNLSSKQMPKHKYKKFERGEEKPRFRLGEDEFKLIQNLADYRFLSSNHLLALNPHLAERTMQRKLQNLYHSGYIDRPASQFSHDKPSSHIIYAIGKKGAQLVFADRRAQANWTRKNQELKDKFLDHALMISNFRVVLFSALKQIKGAKIVHWQEDDLRDSVIIREQRIPFAPDGFLIIEDKDDLMHFFLEADRGNTGNKKFLQKMKGYWHYWKQDKYIKKFNFDIGNDITGIA